MRRLLLATVVALALLVPGLAHAAEGAAYSDPELSDDLAELLRADWPNRYSAEEEALPPDSPVRAALWRARVAAKALPPLARSGSIEADASGRMKLKMRVTRRTPAGQIIDDRILDFGPLPAVQALRSSALATAPYGGIWKYFAGPLGTHPPDYPQFDVWYFYIRAPHGEVHAARDMPSCVWSTERSADVNCLIVSPNHVAAEQALYDSLLAQPVGQVLWNGRYCDPNYSSIWQPTNPVKCLTRLTTHNRFVRELPEAYFLDNDGQPVDRTVNWIVPATLDLTAAQESLDEEPLTVVEWIQRQLRPQPRVVFLPGVVGSNLSLGSQLPHDPGGLWPRAVAVPLLIPFLEVGRDGETSIHDVRATGVIGEAFKWSAVYKEALDRYRMLEAQGTLRDFIAFDYDFRLGVDHAARELATTLLDHCFDGPTWLVAHSTGGLVVKRALQLVPDAAACLDGGGFVSIAVPHLGAPKAVGALIDPDLFFAEGKSQALADAPTFSQVLNNWLTVWELMPRAAIPGHPLARPDWFVDFHDGLGDLNIAAEPLNQGLDTKASLRAAAYFSPPPVKTANIFGGGVASPEGFTPGRCGRTATGERLLTHVDRDVEPSHFSMGDGTIPLWSSSWPGAGLPAAASYAVMGVKHGELPNDDAVLRLVQSIVLSTGSNTYPEWPDRAPTRLHGPPALDLVNVTAPVYWVQKICSPAIGYASVEGKVTGVLPDGSILDEIEGSAVQQQGGAGPAEKRQSIFVPAGGEPPVYSLFGTANGRVVVWQTDPDGSQHDFEFMIEFADRATLQNVSGEWVLEIDRGGDGTFDETLRENHPLVSIRSGGGSPVAGEGVGLALQAEGVSLSGGGLAFDWELLEGEGELVGEDETAIFTPEDGPATAKVRVTVTDSEGKTASAEIEIQIENRAPAVDAGPDLSAPWGVPIAFSGFATDAAPDVAAGLALRWSFGDGSTAEGAEQLHTYAEPRGYEATLTATDRDGDSGSDTVSVNVLKRLAELSVDRLEAPFGTRELRFVLADTVSPSTARLEGRTLRVELDGISHEVAVGADGTATLTLATPPATGAHALLVALADDELYDAAALTRSLAISNGLGDVEGAARYDTTAQAAFAVHSDAGRLTGQLQYRSADRIRLHSDVITGFGIVGGAAWFSGVATDGRRFVARAEPGAFSLWIDGRLEPGATVDAGAIQVRPG